MKKRTAVIGVLVSLLPMGQPLLIGTSAALTSTAVMLAVPEKAKAESASFYFGRGLEKAKSKDYQGSISDFSKAIESNQLSEKDLSSAYANRGRAKDYNGDPYGAISDFNKAIKIDPRNPNTFRSLGITKIKINDMEGACAAWRKASSLGSKDAVKWVKEDC